MPCGRSSSREQYRYACSSHNSCTLPSYRSHKLPLPLCTQVKLGLEEVVTDLFRVKPCVYSAPNNSAVIVFSGAARGGGGR